MRIFSVYLLFIVILIQFTRTNSSVGYFIGTDNSGTLIAGDVCNNAGGRLAMITDSESFDEASSTASSSGYGWVVVALHCTSRDTSCSESPSKWTWYDSQNDNEDLCDISTGGLDSTDYYQPWEPWDQWDKTPEENEYCVEFYGGKLVLEFCPNPDGIIIDSDTSLPYAALCQPLTASMCTASDDDDSIDTDIVLILCVAAGGFLCSIIAYYCWKTKKAKKLNENQKKSSFIQSQKPTVSQQPPPTQQTVSVQQIPQIPQIVTPDPVSSTDGIQNKKHEAEVPIDHSIDKEVPRVQQPQLQPKLQPKQQPQPQPKPKAVYVPAQKRKTLTCPKGYKMHYFVTDKYDGYKLYYQCVDCKRVFNHVMAMYSCQRKVVYNKWGDVISPKSECPHHKVHDYNLCPFCARKRM